MHTDIINTTSSYKRTPHTEVAYTNCLASSLNIFIDKTLVPSFSTLFTYLSIDRKLYYNGSIRGILALTQVHAQGLLGVAKASLRLALGTSL